jgi:hypothetical protein
MCHRCQEDRALRRIIHQHEVNQHFKDKVSCALETEVEKQTREIAEQKIVIERDGMTILILLKNVFLF